MAHAKFYWAPPGSNMLPSERGPWDTGRPAYVTPRVLFNQMPESDLIRLQGELRAEVSRRLGPKLQCMANFMAGVTQAMACRSFLRWSKGLTPHQGAEGSRNQVGVKQGTLAGSTPTAGEMWNAEDGSRAERLLAIELTTNHLAGAKPRRSFNPMTGDAGFCIDQLKTNGL